MTDDEDAESYDQKVSFPLGSRPVIIGAASYRDRFREFNSKLLLKVEEQLTVFDLKNIGDLVKAGWTHSEAVDVYTTTKA